MSAPKAMRWSKFWWQDYERDPALRACSLASQGLWMRLLCLMHEATPYGHLVINGRVPDAKRIAAMIGKPEREVAAALSELEELGVFSRTSEAIIYCRRMVRDNELVDCGKLNGANGGNPEIRRGTVPKEDRVRPYRRSDSPNKTERIFQKNGERCFWCSVKLQRDHAGPDFFRVDHFLPVCDGGTNDEDNLVPACAECNHKRTRINDPTGNPTATPVSVGPNSDSNPTPKLDAKSTEKETESKNSPVRPPSQTPPVASRAAPPTHRVSQRGSRLPEAWQPSEADRAFATGLGLEPGAVLEEFRDYWRAVAGRSACKTDWSATWRNRCRELGARAGRKAGRPPKLGVVGAALADLETIWAQRAAGTASPANLHLGVLGNGD